MKLETSKQIAAAPAKVWDIITDLGASPERITGITAVERLDDGVGFGVGTTWRETRVMFGREATEVMKVVEVEDGRGYVTEADGPGVLYRSEMRVEPAGDGSLLTMTFDAEPRTFVAKLLGNTVGRLMVGATRKAVRQDLEDIAAVAEA